MVLIYICSVSAPCLESLKIYSGRAMSLSKYTLARFTVQSILQYILGKVPCPEHITIYSGHSPISGAYHCDMISEYILGRLGTSHKQKCSFNLGIFQTGSDPPPPKNFATFGALFRRLFFCQNFWGTFCHISPKS